MSQNTILPLKERRKIRDKKIRALHRIGYSYDEICVRMKEQGEGVSKTTVFFAINGRSKKSAATSKRKKDTFKKIEETKHNHLK